MLYVSTPEMANIIEIETGQQLPRVREVAGWESSMCVESRGCLVVMGMFFILTIILVITGQGVTE